jgi:hypothetical protein
MEPESFDLKSIPPTNLAVLLGLIYVILEGPYVAWSLERVDLFVF